jgi:photosystem II stability/assembly factor-like uncharacterized protein
VPVYFQLVSPGNAWIATANADVFRTSDGGRQWSTVTPSLRRLLNAYESVSGFVATSANHAILAIAGEVSHTATLFATVNGGATWTRTDIAGYGIDWFSFITERDGWVESGQGGAAGQEAADIWHTDDGGIRWSLMSRGARPQSGAPGSAEALGSGCDKTGIGFANATTGYATGDCINGAYFAVTHDAGRTWQYPSLPLPRGVTLTQVHADAYQQETGPPDFDQAHAAGTMIGTTVVGQKATARYYFYVSTDGGGHWTIAYPPLPNATWTLAVDATHWWAGDRARIVVTTDAGAHWTAINANGILAINALQFASPSDAWALISERTGSNELMQTTDSGHTWQAVPLPKIATGS